jgi:hypothetical protein
VVRVERPRHGGSSQRLRFCGVMLGEDKMVCLGSPPPRPGELIELAEYMGSYRGQARVVAVEAVDDPSMRCNVGNAHAVEIEMVTGGTKSPSQMVFGVTGFPVDPARVRTLSDMTALKAPGGRPGEHPLLALDGDGDGNADLMVTFYECTNDVPTNSGAASASCLEFWRNDGIDNWRMAQRDVIYICH